MSKIYCVYCGSENDDKNKKCSKCKKELNPEEHLFKEYLKSHIKSELIDKAKDNTFSLITKYIESHWYGALMTIALVFTASTGVAKIIKTSETIVDTKPSVALKSEALDVNSELVQSIYKYNQINVYKDHDDFYQMKPVTYDDLSENVKFDLAFRYVSRTGGSGSHDTSSCEFLKGYSLYEGCLKEPEYFLDYHYLGVVKKDLENAWHNLYGTKYALPLGEFWVDQCLQCEYSEENDDYLCYMGMVGGYGTPEEHTKIIKAEKYGDEITIYDYYVLEGFDGVYKDPDEKTLISEEWDESLIEKGQIYKHTYKIDKNENYYWLSSEPVDEVL